jgi:hypothetical protein
MEQTEKLRLQLKLSPKYFYKVVRKRDDCYESYWQFKKIPKSGLYKSNRTWTRLDPRNRYLYRGIHVYITKQAAINSYEYDNNKTLAIIRVKCFAKNFIAASDKSEGEALFTKVLVMK